MKTASFLLSLLLLTTNCSKGDGKPPTTIVPPPVAVGFTDKDATTAYNSFNGYFYSTADKLYYVNTEKKDIGAIWTQAIYWDMAMNVYKRTKDAADLQRVRDIFEGGYNRYDKYNWNNTKEWFIYDDMMWWVISLARGYQLTGTKEYLDLSVSGFKRVWDGSFDPDGGGMFWDFNHSGKNACINFPTVIAAMTLYKITGDGTYLQNAKDIFAWGADNLYDKTTGRVADNNVRGNKGWSDYTYNQGTFIGAAVALYKATGTAAYLDMANQAAVYTQKSMSDANGILPAEGDWNEQGVLKAIFGQYIMQLISEGNQTQFLPWIQKNINAAWGNRDVTRGLTYRNYKIPCATGTLQSYEASSAVYMMQICPPAK
ncbi:glycoside hydrolase family 76 protein [Chitinophaga sp. 212800010-3]|uniref:glycoside hydrolase family 76 protein n=1 Tax=unclassified Chitinophaga TaxID=2619133 RepID=UPI002DEFCEB6|nr:Glycosyl hydrolase family 76 [Chitinophaga sp. 212800010-3]